jgi:hypothetical protein
MRSEFAGGLMAYTRGTTISAAHGADTVKSAVLSINTDLTAAFTNLNAHEALTTGVHGVTSSFLDAADIDDTPVNGATTDPISSNWAYTHNLLTNSSGIVTPRVTSITSSATPTYDVTACDILNITALAEDVTSMTDNCTGTPVNFQALIVQILDNGSSRNITWGDKFSAMAYDIPSATTASKALKIGFLDDTVKSVWGCVGIQQEV